MCIASSIINNLMTAIEGVNNYKSDLAKRQSDIDKEISNLYHKIETTRFNACEGYYFSKQLQENLIERRKVKNELCKLNTLNQIVNIESLKGKVSKAGGRIDKLKTNQIEYLKNTDDTYEQSVMQ